MKPWFVALLFPIAAFAFLENQFLSLSDGEKLLGTAKFNAAQFKSGDAKVRASMAVDLIHSDYFVGEKMTIVTKELGPSDGHYNTSREPAYRLGDDGVNFLQLVFLPDSSGHMVEEVKIHKRCCVTAAATPPTVDKTEVQATKTTMGLLLQITGAAAKTMFENMTKIQDVQGVKIGDSVTCSKATTTGAPIYSCEFSVNTAGTIRR